MCVNVHTHACIYVNYKSDFVVCYYSNYCFKVTSTFPQKVLKHYQKYPISSETEKVL